MDHNRINYYKNGVVVIDDFLPTDVYNEMVDIFYKGEYDLYVRIMPMADIQIPVIKINTINYSLWKQNSAIILKNPFN